MNVSFIIRLMLTFQLRLKSSSERCVWSPFAAQIRGEQVIVDVGKLFGLQTSNLVS